ncbi:uncharacterized protein LOC124384990 isoform X2 [Silurus meridionalis]|uniref:uncharacterized protein LOC124384990 isoform X2 n=1 Tax=Silurus meridionalis TaxID=175797 RepID=UPI001EEB8B40|nr:uncharacterized protein LOC124384990 isoform X2 [Silurus meridionalis]
MENCNETSTQDKTLQPQMPEFKPLSFAILGSKIEILARKTKEPETHIPDSSSDLTKQESRHNEAPEEVLAHENNIMATEAEQDACPPPISTTCKSPIESSNIIRQFGPEHLAKSPWKTRQLLQIHKTDPMYFWPDKAMIKDIRKRMLPHTLESGRTMAHNTPSDVNDETPMMNSEQDTSNTEVMSESPDSTTDNQAQLKGNIIDAVLKSITLTSFKDQLTQRITNEIDVRLAKVISQFEEQQLALEFESARDQSQNISQEQPSRANVSMCEFSDCVASMIGFALIEIREKLKNDFRSQSNNDTASPAASDTASDIVDKVFEDILNSLIPISDDTSNVSTPTFDDRPDS